MIKSEWSEALPEAEHYSPLDALTDDEFRYYYLDLQLHIAELQQELFEASAEFEARGINGTPE